MELIRFVPNGIVAKPCVSHINRNALGTINVAACGTNLIIAILVEYKGYIKHLIRIEGGCEAYICKITRNRKLNLCSLLNELLLMHLFYKFRKSPCGLDYGLFQVLLGCGGRKVSCRLRCRFRVLLGRGGRKAGSIFGNRVLRCRLRCRFRCGRIAPYCGKHHENRK